MHFGVGRASFYLFYLSIFIYFYLFPLIFIVFLLIPKHSSIQMKISDFFETVGRQLDQGPKNSFSPKGAASRHKRLFQWLNSLRT